MGIVCHGSCYGLTNGVRRSAQTHVLHAVGGIADEQYSPSKRHKGKAGTSLCTRKKYWDSDSVYVRAKKVLASLFRDNPRTTRDTARYGFTSHAPANSPAAAHTERAWTRTRKVAGGPGKVPIFETCHVIATIERSHALCLLIYPVKVSEMTMPSQRSPFPAGQTIKATAS